MIRSRELLLGSVPVLAAFAALAAAVWGAGQARRAREFEALADEYMSVTQSACARCCEELSDAVGEMALSLEKLTVAGSARLTVTALEDAASGSRAAASILSRLPLGCAATQSDAAFLNRVGEYARSLELTVLAGGELNHQERDRLASLLEAAQEMSRDALYALSSGEAPTGLEELDFYADADSAHTWPRIDYDGEFAERSLPEPLCNAAPEASPEEALEKARTLIGPDAQPAGVTGGRLAVYAFVSGERELELTVHGLEIVHLSEPPQTGEDAEPANSGALEAAANAYLLSLGFEDMTPAELTVDGGEARFVFVPAEEGVLILSDRVRVTLEADSARPVGFDAGEYLANKRARAIPRPAVGPDEARAALSKNLTVTGRTLALVPLTPYTEELCYAFDCTSGGGEYRVYVSAMTGEELLIQKLLRENDGFRLL
ncbi:MAG: germination protein YpeB [Clostridia bacterium]|nr:germination protein YpeB [Clostridia bacterium]